MNIHPARFHLAAALVLATLAGSTLPALAQTNTFIKAESSATVSQDANGHKTVIVYRNGDVERAEVDGQDIPKDHIQRTGDHLKITDTAGNTLYEGLVPSVAGGQDAQPGTLRPWSNQPGSPSLPTAPLSPRPFPPNGTNPPPSPAPSAYPVARKSMVGLGLIEPEAALRGHFALKPGEVTQVGSVSEGLPAAAAGISAYDLIVAVDGKSPAGPDAVRAMLGDKEPGTPVELTIIHHGERKTVTLTPEAYDRQKLEQAPLASVITITPGQHGSAFTQAIPSQGPSQGMAGTTSPFFGSFMAGPGGAMSMGGMDPDMARAMQDAMDQLNSAFGAAGANMPSGQPAGPDALQQMLRQRMEQLQQLRQQQMQIQSPQPQPAPTQDRKPTTQA